jgi:hypothetical protein
MTHLWIHGMCVCVRERERETERENVQRKINGKIAFCTCRFGLRIPQEWLRNPTKNLSCNVLSPAQDTLRYLESKKSEGFQWLCTVLTNSELPHHMRLRTAMFQPIHVLINNSSWLSVIHCRICLMAENMTFFCHLRADNISFGRWVPAVGRNLGACASKYTDFYPQRQKY